MIDPASRLATVAEQLEIGQVPESVTVRTFLSWFGAKRRGYLTVRQINAALASACVATEPDFEGAFIDSEIAFRAVMPDEGQSDPTAGGAANAVAADSTPQLTGESEEDDVQAAAVDPAYRIGRLAAANRPLVYVHPDAPIEEAVTIMMLHDYSQIPVMENSRRLVGVVSWKSIGMRRALKTSGATVRSFIDPAVEVSADAFLFNVIGRIIERQYVLVRDTQNRITGVVTTTDLSMQFRQLAEPFLLLEEIEKRMRRLIDDRFTTEELQSACDPNDPTRLARRAADLTFGGYLRLLQNPERWEKLGIPIERGSFVQRLDEVRSIRNDVMHFDADGISEDELTTLRTFVKFLQSVQSIGAA